MELQFGDPVLKGNIGQAESPVNVWQGGLNHVAHPVREYIKPLLLLTGDAQSFEVTGTAVTNNVFGCGKVQAFKKTV